MQPPTCINVRIRSTCDAHKIFFAVQRGTLPMISKRLDADERLALCSGCVYAWEERGPNTEVTGLGIERFTEGRRWSPSRVRDEFLFYYEKYTPPQDAPQSSSMRHPPRDWDPLVKQTYSVWVTTDKGRRKWHLTAYFTQTTVDQLGTIDDVPGVGDLLVPDGLFQTTRVTKARKADDPRGHSTGDIFKPSASTVTRTYAAFPYNTPPSHPLTTAPHASYMYESYPEHANHGHGYHPTGGHYVGPPHPRRIHPTPPSSHRYHDADVLPSPTSYNRYDDRDAYNSPYPPHSYPTHREDIPRHRPTSNDTQINTHHAPHSHHPLTGPSSPFRRAHTYSHSHDPSTTIESPPHHHPSQFSLDIERQSNVRAEPLSTVRPSYRDRSSTASVDDSSEYTAYNSHHPDSHLKSHSPARDSSSSSSDTRHQSPRDYDDQEDPRGDIAHAGNIGPCGLAPLHHLQRVQPYRRDPLDDKALRMLGL